MMINWKIKHIIENCIRLANRLKYNELRKRYEVEGLHLTL